MALTKVGLVMQVAFRDRLAKETFSTQSGMESAQSQAERDRETTPRGGHMATQAPSSNKARANACARIGWASLSRWQRKEESCYCRCCCFYCCCCWHFVDARPGASLVLGTKLGASKLMDDRGAQEVVVFREHSTSCAPPNTVGSK